MNTIRRAFGAVMALLCLVFAGPLSAAIQFQQVTNASNNSSSTLTIPRPIAPGLNQFMIAQITWQKDAAITAPAGWQIVQRADVVAQAADLAQVMYWKRVTANEPASYSWTYDKSVKAAGGLLLYSGVDTLNPIVDSAQGQLASGDVLTAPSINVEANSMLVAVYGIKRNTTLSVPTGMAQRLSEVNTLPARIMAADQAIALAGTSGTRVSNAGQAATWIAQIVNFRDGSGRANPYESNTRIDALAASSPVAQNVGVKVKLVDVNNVGVAGVAVTFAGSNSNPLNGVTFANASGLTDANGEYQTTVTTNFVGNVSVTAQFDSADADALPDSPVINGSPAVIEFFSIGPVDPANAGTNLQVLVASAVADGSATTSVRANLADQFGNPVRNVEVLFAENTAASITDDSGTSNNAGRVDASLTSFVAGVAPVSAKFDSDDADTIPDADIAIGSPANVTFTAGAVDPTQPQSAFSITDDEATANGTDFGRALVKLVDANDNPVPGIAVNFSTTGGTLTPSGAVTDAQGEVSVEVRNTVAGVVSVSATYGANFAITGSPGDITFVAGPPTAGVASTLLAATDDTGVVNVADTGEVTATITDANGNPVANINVEFATLTAGATLGDSTGTTDGQGQVSTKVSSTALGTVDVTAAFDADGNASYETAFVTGSPAQVTFAADAGDPNQSGTRIDVLDAEARADNADAGQVRLTVLDSAGNPVAGTAVTFATTGTATFATQDATTDTQGQAFATLTSATIESVNVTASFDANGNSTPVVNGLPATVSFYSVGPVDPARTETLIVATDAAAESNGTDTGAVRVVLVDANGNPVRDVTVDFATTGTATFATPSGKTNAQGVYTSTLTSTVAATVPVTAEFDTNSDNDADAPVVNGSPANVVFSSTDGDPTIAGTRIEVIDGSATANGADTGLVRVTLLDAQGAAVSNVRVSFSATGGATLGTVDGFTDASGQVDSTVASTVATTINVTASFDTNGDNTADTGVVNGSPAAVVFGAGPVDVNNAGTKIEATDAIALADGVDTGAVRVTLVDANGNAVSGVAVSVQLSSGSASLTTLTGTTNATGQFSTTLTSTVVGSASVVALFDASGDATPDTSVNGDADVTFGEFDVDASISKRVSRSLILANGTGDRVEYEIVARNAGSMPIFDANVLDALPDGYANATWTCVAAGGASCGAAAGTGDISEIVDLPVGGSVTYLVVGLVADVPSFGFVNTAVVDVANDIDPSNNSARASYQACVGNVEVGNTGTLLVHGCMFRDGFENLSTD